MWLVGVVVRRYIDFLILLIPTPLVSVLFCSSIPTFCSFKKCFSFLFQYFFVIKFYVLNFFPPQYKHTYGRLWASHGSHMKAAHNVLYMKHTKRTLHILRWTSAVCLQGAGCRFRSRGSALYRDASRAGRTRARPASFKGRRSRTRGRSQCVFVKIWRSTWKTYLVRCLNVIVR